jgi:maltooligosyltrehalose synthase
MTDYIQWLEGELTDKINESGLLRAQNRALIEENSRLTALTKMLLSAPEFATYLGELSSNPQKLAQLQRTTPSAQQQQPRVPSHAAVPGNLNQMTLQQRSQHFQQQFSQHAKQAKNGLLPPQGNQQALFVA